MGKDRLFGALGLVCVFGSGCFSYSPYGYPGTYPAAPHTAMISQPVPVAPATPGTAWVPASPTPAASNATSARPGEVIAPQPARRSEPEAADHLDEPNDREAVPDPVEPGKSAAPETEPYGLNEDTPAERPAVTIKPRPRRRINEEGEIVPVAADERADGSESELVLTDAETTMESNTIQSAEFQTEVRSNTAKSASAKQGIYGHDAEGFTWLKGIVEFDRASQAWHLTYSQAPVETDPYGGEVTLKNTPLFKSLIRNGQVITVRGEFDPSQRDRLGKPVYDVQELVRDVPQTR